MAPSTAAASTVRPPGPALPRTLGVRFPTTVGLRAPLARVFVRFPTTVGLRAPLARVFVRFPTTVGLRAPLARVFVRFPTTVGLRAPLARVFVRFPTTVGFVAAYRGRHCPYGASARSAPLDHEAPPRPIRAAPGEGERGLQAAAWGPVRRPPATTHRRRTRNLTVPLAGRRRGVTFGQPARGPDGRMPPRSHVRSAGPRPRWPDAAAESRSATSPRPRWPDAAAESRSVSWPAAPMAGCRRGVTFGQLARGPDGRMPPRSHVRSAGPRPRWPDAAAESRSANQRAAPTAGSRHGVTSRDWSTPSEWRGSPVS